MPNSCGRSIAATGIWADSVGVCGRASAAESMRGQAPSYGERPSRSAQLNRVHRMWVGRCPSPRGADGGSRTDASAWGIRGGESQERLERRLEAGLSHRPPAARGGASRLTAGDPCHAVRRYRGVPEQLRANWRFCFAIARSITAGTGSRAASCSKLPARHPRRSS